MRYPRIVEIKEIQIEGARAMQRMQWAPARFDFDRLKLNEEIERRGIGGKFDGSIQEGLGAWRAIHGGGFVNFGAEERAGFIVEGKEPPPGLTQVCETVAKIGSQCNTGSHG